jgi:uncharacterized protein (TIGR04255 family)
MIFSNPPLVELIAELRWIPGTASAPIPAQGGANQLVQGVAIQQGVTIQFPLTAPYLEESFSRFSIQAAAQGFGMSERLIPTGFPLLPFTVVYRFRKPPAAGGNFLYQIGPGLFSANALPPYRDWDSFRPIVREGVQALLTSRPSAENGPFATVVLRYIDLFTEEFTEGKQSLRFLNEILGLKLELPNILSEQISDINAVQSGIQLSMPLRNGLAMNLLLQNGAAAGRPGILMSTEVLTVQPTPPDISAVMQSLESAHTSVRLTFMGLTEKLSARMQPVH